MGHSQPLSLHSVGYLTAPPWSRIRLRGSRTRRSGVASNSILSNTDERRFGQVETNYRCPIFGIRVMSQFMAISSEIHVPDALKELSNWVGWREGDTKDGKQSKFPINPHDGKCNVKPDDPSTWGT